MPMRVLSLALDSTEFLGRRAGSGYSLEAIGTTLHERPERASISLAKPHQLVLPAVLRW